MQSNAALNCAACIAATLNTTLAKVFKLFWLIDSPSRRLLLISYVFRNLKIFKFFEYIFVHKLVSVILFVISTTIPAHTLLWTVLNWPFGNELRVFTMTAHNKLALPSMLSDAIVILCYDFGNVLNLLTFR